MKAAKSGRNSFSYLYEERTLEPVRTRRRAGRAERSIVNAWYVLFLSVVCIATVLMCVKFLQLKETATAMKESNENLKTELSHMVSENDARYEKVTNDIDWDYVRDVAINKLNMKYADKDQIIWYNSADEGYIRQYGDVPD